MKKKDNEPLPALFSGEFREAVRRLKHKESELDSVLETEEKAQELEQKDKKNVNSKEQSE